MNRSAWMSALMKSNISQNLMKMFGYKRKKSRSMTYSIMGVVASAAAAYAFRNRDGMRQLFQNTSTGNSFNRPVSAGLTEFAKEITSGMADTQSTNKSSGYHATSSTNPESSQLISQIASAAKQEGNSGQVDQMTDKLIKRNI
ncbi:hypothetical protein [Mesobacillus thioparans]|uniref:hypothetical protein n=1 Tax=Mesobacillus thioparans TaxID=370439 RepID=UPI0039EF35AC